MSIINNHLSDFDNAIDNIKTINIFKLTPYNIRWLSIIVYKPYPFCQYTCKNYFFNKNFFFNIHMYVKIFEDFLFDKLTVTYLRQLVNTTMIIVKLWTVYSVSVLKRHA